MSVEDGVFPGAMIGEIQVTGTLGSGGMGDVFSGFDLRLERKVALKVIRPERRLDHDTRLRFLREARMLSRIKYPNICQIHDLIERPEGDVLILELVEGRNLREVINEGLDHAEALAIGRQLLEVLIAVHRQGIVHRDLKPENIIVQPNGSIKVLDFGIARADGEGPSATSETTPGVVPLEESDLTAEWVSERTDNLTARHFLVGTLQYMSPEQARGEHVGPASDIFSAGLILQELLTGEAPFEKGLPMDVLLKKVAWGDIRPPIGLAAALRGFLGRLTSLAPADRPSSRDALDQLGSIQDAPRRRRQRILLIATSCLMTVLAAGMTVQWFRASREADRARRSLAEAQEVSSFLEQLFYLSDPFVVQEETQSDSGESITAEELLDRGATTVEKRFEDQPLARARFMVLLGSIHRRLGRFDRASEMLEQAVAIRKARLPSDHPDLGRALLELGAIQRRQAKFGESAESLEQALSVFTKGGAGASIDRADILEEMALLAADKARFQEAEALYRQVLEFRRTKVSGHELALALTLQRSAAVELALGRRDRAHERLAEALEIVREKQLGDSLAEVSLLNELARLEVVDGRFNEAEQHWESGLETARSRLPADHTLLATLLTNLANILDEQGRFSEAEPLYREALVIKEKAVGTGHPQYAEIVFNLGRLSENQGRLDEAELLYEQALETFENSLGAGHPLVGIGLNSLAILKQEKKEYLKAEHLYHRALAIFEKAFGRDHPYSSMVLNNLGEVNRLYGRMKIAEGYYREALEIGEKVNGPDHPSTAEVLRGLAITCAALGKIEEAETCFQRALTILETAGMPTDQVLADREASRLSLADRNESNKNSHKKARKSTKTKEGS